MLPRTKWAETLSIQEQMSKITGELCEVYGEFMARKVDHQRVADELADLMQALWTGLLILERTHGIDPAGTLRAMVKKNADRGYYVPA